MEDVLAHFPRIEHAFAYGSGVFDQPGLYPDPRADARPLVDLIFAVEDPPAWHAQVREGGERAEECTCCPCALDRADAHSL